MQATNHRDILQIETAEGIVVVGLVPSSILGVEMQEVITQQLRELVNSAVTTKLLIDFSNVSFFSSQMLGLLVDLWRRLKETGGQLAICGINPQLTRVFRITHLDKLFTFYPDRRTALSVNQFGA